MPQRQMPELGFHRPIPRWRVERKGENKEEGERGETNGGSRLYLYRDKIQTSIVSLPAPPIPLPHLLVAADGAFSASSGGKTLSRTTKPTVPLGQLVRMPAEMQ